MPGLKPGRYIGRTGTKPREILRCTGRPVRTKRTGKEKASACSAQNDERKIRRYTTQNQARKTANREVGAPRLILGEFGDGFAVFAGVAGGVICAGGEVALDGLAAAHVAGKGALQRDLMTFCG